MIFADCFWPDGTTTTVASARHKRMHHHHDEDKVQMVVDGTQQVTDASTDINRLVTDSKKAAMETKQVMLQIAYNVDDGISSLCVLSSIIKYLTQAQGDNCEGALESGSPLPIRPQTTTSHAVSNTRGRRSGSVMATSLRNGS